MPGSCLTRTAREDLKATGRYTRLNWGWRHCDAYLTHLDRRFHALAELSSLGGSCDDIRPGYRRYSEGPIRSSTASLVAALRVCASCTGAWTLIALCDPRQAPPVSGGGAHSS
jgi:plasmid stabilization system protein ParE